MANNVIEIKITASNAQAIAALKQVADAANSTGSQIKNAGSQGSNAFGGATSSGKGFVGTLGEVGMAAAGIYATFQALKGLISTVFGSGFNFSKNMETSQLGMAGILQSMTLINGQAVDFNQAMAISGDMMKQLQKDALKTSASTEELVNVFQATLAPGLNAGMSLDQIRQLSVVGVNAIKSLKVPAQQVVQEMRDLVQGGITASGSTLATALGIKDSDIEKAKNSSEGLFKFLMDRMNGFNETSKRFPDTMQGSIDQMKEIWTMASAKFTSAFEEPIKDGLKTITELVGTVNTETGDFEVNPSILTFLDEVKGGYRDVKGLIRDVKNICGTTFDGDAESASRLYTATKNLIGILEDLGRIAVQISLPGMELFGKELDLEIQRLEWLTDKAKKCLDYLARLSGAKGEPIPENSSWNDNTRGDRDYVPPSLQPAKITAKYTPENKEAIKAAQEALKMSLDTIKSQTKQTIDEFNRQIKELEVVYSEKNDVSILKQINELKQQIQQAKVSEVEQSIGAVNEATFEKEIDRQSKINSLTNDLNEATAALKPFGNAINEVTNLLNTKAEEGSSWTRETDSVNIEGLHDVATDAISALSQYFQQLTGRQMIVSSGLRDWGGHVNGNKFDVVDSYDSEILEQNQDGIRDKIIEYARSIGLQVLDEYASPSEHATAGHLDFDATDFSATVGIEQLKAKAKNLQTEAGREVYKAILKLYEDAAALVKELAEAKGDSSEQQKAEIKQKYNDMIAKFTVNKMPEAATNAAKVRDYEMLKIDAAQTQQSLGYGTSDLKKEQDLLVANVTTGNMDIADAISKLNASYESKVAEGLAKLQALAATAKIEGYEPTARKLEEGIKSIKSTLQDGIAALISAFETKLQNNIQKVQSDLGLTTMEKDSRINALKLASYDTRISSLNSQLLSADEGKASGIKQAIAETQTLKDNLLKLSDTNYMVQQSFRESFESGLLTFLTDGVTKCETLAEAFKNFASSVVSSIQRIYAEAITKDIMSAFKLGDYNSKPGTSTGAQTVAQQAAAGATLNNTSALMTVNTAIYQLISTMQTLSMSGSSDSSSSSSSGISSSNLSSITDGLNLSGLFADGGSMDSGEVKGPGTGTSDSILAYLGNFKKFVGISNGEYMIKSAAVKKFGTRFFESLNNGLIPSSFLRVKAMFADGGSMSGKILDGPQALAASLSSGDTNVHLRNVNLFDTSQIGDYMQSRNGEKVMLNLMKGNAATYSRVLKFRG